MIEFTDIDFSGDKITHVPHHHHDEPHQPCPPPLDPALRGLFDFINHVDKLAHKALDVASMSSMDASSARKLAEQTSAILKKVSALANKADIKASNALADISIIKINITNLINELSKIKAGAGLNSDGSYKTKLESNYINDATSLDSADLLLDTALKSTNDTVEGLVEELSSVGTNLDGIITRLTNLENQVQSNSDNIDTISQSIVNYIAGDGIEIDGNQINSKVNPESEDFLSLTSNGLKLSGVKTYVDNQYVAGPGLFKGYVDDQKVYHPEKNNEGEWPFAIKIAENSKNYLGVTGDGLSIDIDALNDVISGSGNVDVRSLAGEHLQYNEQTNKLDVDVQSLVADQNFINAVTGIVNNAMLWELGQNNQIQPKDNRDVYVAGKITATGPIYSEEA